jgi:hypothetical protein
MLFPKFHQDAGEDRGLRSFPGVFFKRRLRPCSERADHFIRPSDALSQELIKPPNQLARDLFETPRFTYCTHCLI